MYHHPNAVYDRFTSKPANRAAVSLRLPASYDNPPAMPSRDEDDRDEERTAMHLAAWLLLVVVAIVVGLLAWAISNPEAIGLAMVAIAPRPPRMTTSGNVQILDLSDGRQVCLSYGTIVAAFVPGRGYLRTDARFSVTTSKHMNQFAGKDAPCIPHAELVALCAPIASRQ